MREGKEEGWRRLRALTDIALAAADDITVAIVLNRKEAISDDPDNRATEFMSDHEANELITGLREGGFRTRYYEGESTFVASVLESQPRIGTSRFSIVYNIAQSGTDPGRKSMIPSFCALNGIPTCNSNSYAVSLARHKFHVHALLRRFGLPTPDTWSFAANAGWLMGEKPPSGQTLIAKAAYESASIGLDHDSVGNLSDEYERILAAKSARLQQPMIVQRLIEGREFETPVIQIDGRFKGFGPIGITLDGDAQLGCRILAYDSVAHDGFGFAPGEADRTLGEKLRNASANVCEVLGLGGFARVDFRVDDDGNARVIDVATSPHIVRHSSYWVAFEQEGWSYPEMLACMVAVNGDRLGWFGDQPSDQT
jgi:D-alanine-D-alanine ligase